LQKQKIKHIAIVGSGNTANVLAQLFYSHHFIIDSIVSRNTITGKYLANIVNSNFSSHFSILPSTQLILICTPDSEIASVVQQINNTEALVCHCAGSVDMDILNQFKNYGVVYPLQTLSKNLSKKDFEIPFLIEANTLENEILIQDFIDTNKQNKNVVTSKMRLQYHLAAVFANNFSNAMFMAAQQIAEIKNLDFNLLKPLILQTVEKIKDNLPSQVQTGPALRGDELTIHKHLELLKNEHLLEEIYTLVSKFIAKKKFIN